MGVEVMSGARVLMVDDEPNVRLVFRSALESAGFVVAEAPDGERALMRLQEFPADVILLDLQMPRMGGMEVLQRLRQAGNNVPVVIITAHGYVVDAVEAMKLGAIDFLMKPLKPEALRNVVREVLLRHSRPDRSRVGTGEPRALINLIRAKRALNRREFGEAERLLRRTIEQYPASAEAHTLLGILCERLGERHPRGGDARAGGF
jgi:DNA-binding response OmpR family regulator